MNKEMGNSRCGLNIANSSYSSSFRWPRLQWLKLLVNYFVSPFCHSTAVYYNLIAFFMFSDRFQSRVYNTKLFLNWKLFKLLQIHSVLMTVT
jgi:hypothetical protein